MVDPVKLDVSEISIKILILLQTAIGFGLRYSTKATGNSMLRIDRPLPIS